MVSGFLIPAGEPEWIRKAIYTMNVIESLNSLFLAAINKRKMFPTDDSVRKVIYFSNEGYFENMEYADPKVAADYESFYSRFR